MIGTRPTFCLYSCWGVQQTDRNVTITDVDVRTDRCPDVIARARYGWSEEARSLTTGIHQPQQTMDGSDHDIYAYLFTYKYYIDPSTKLQRSN